MVSANSSDDTPGTVEGLGDVLDKDFFASRAFDNL
jgi:hypothetical protein